MTITSDAPPFSAAGSRSQEILDRIEDIAAELEAEAAPTEAQAKLTDRAVELLVSAGVTKVFLPEELGGMGMYPGEAMPVLDRVSYVDGSIGWVNTIFAAAGHMIGYVSEDSARRLFESGQPLFGAVSNGAGTAEAVDGGWKVSGSFRYASGSKHADYMFCPAQKIVDGQPLPPPAGAGMFLIPTAQITFGEGWDTIGLRGTGSVDFSFEDVLVPVDHELNFFGPPALGGRAAAGGMFLLIVLMHLGFATGITRRILDEIKEFANRPATRPGAKRVAEGERFRVEYAQKYLAARAAKASVDLALADIDATLRAGERVSRRQTTILMGSSIHAHDVARDVAQWAFRRGGGVALRSGTLQRAIRDALAGCQHFIVDDSHLIDIGFDLLGAPDNYMWLGLDLVPVPGTTPGAAPGH